ncbi:MAG TPA: AAA family ATPase, partial [Archangium sp.]
MTKSRKANPADPLAGLPAWARKLAQKYYTKTVSTFLLYGAVRDLQPTTGEDGGRSFGPLRTFLSEELFGGRDHVLFYDRSSGIRSSSPETQKEMQRTMVGYDALYGTDYAKSLPRDPARALQILENFLRMRVSEGKSLALVIDFAETLVPGGEMSHLSAEDRFVLATLEKWAHDPQFL